MPAPIESMGLVAAELQPLDLSFAFVGGCAIWLLVDEPDLTDFRPTDDVDVIVEIVTLTELYELEGRLRSAGFQHDTSEGAPICRWIVRGCRVDIMPIDSKPLGMNSQWFLEALNSAKFVNLQGAKARVLTRPMFLATKLTAFEDRGKGDLYGSHDLEDIVTLIDGCSHIVQEVDAALPEVRSFIAKKFSIILRHPDFDDAMLGTSRWYSALEIVLQR